jgi:outer membrane lipoprotein carrier protein
MTFFRAFVPLLVGLFVSMPVARADDVQTVISGIESTYGNISSLQASFVQINRSAAMGETKQKGKLSLERPRKMRWAFTQPPGKLFVTDGSTMWVWSKADNQVIISPVSGGAAGGGMTQLLDSLDRLSELFAVELMEGGAKFYQLKLTPRNQGNVKRVELTVSRKGYTVEQIRTVDSFDNEMELSLQNVKTNLVLPGSSFSFEIPPNAQVIKTDGP